MPTHNYTGMRKRALARIKHWGGGALSVITDAAGAPRTCYAAVREYTWREQRGGLVQAGGKIIVIAADGLAIPPNPEMDAYIDLKRKDGTTHGRFRMRAGGLFNELAPAGVSVLWEVEVARIELDTV